MIHFSGHGNSFKISINFEILTKIMEDFKSDNIHGPNVSIYNPIMAMKLGMKMKHQKQLIPEL